jgi:hypothetical protein
MSRPPRRGLGSGHVLDQIRMTEVRDWAPPGWHWEVLPSGACGLVRNPGPIIDPNLLWWRSCGPRAVQREPPSGRWYFVVSESRTSTSVVTCMCWTGCIPTLGRFFRNLTWAMILWGFLLFGCPPPAAQDLVDVERFRNRNLVMY